MKVGFKKLSMEQPLTTFGDRLRSALSQAKKRREEIARKIQELDCREKQWCAARVEALAALAEARVAAQKIVDRKIQVEDLLKDLASRAPDDQRVRHLAEQIDVLSQRVGLGDRAAGLLINLRAIIR